MRIKTFGLFSMTIFLGLSISLVSCGEKKVESVKIEGNDVTLNIGDTNTFVATITPNDATDKGVLWASSDVTVGNINQDGVFTALKEGNTTVSVTTRDGYKKDTKLVTVNGSSIVPVDSVTISKDKSGDIYVDDVINFTASVLPENASDKTVKWSIDNSSLASITDSGVFTALAKGQVTVTCASNSDNNKKDTAVINILSPIVPVNSVLINQGEQEIKENAYFQFSATVAPDNASDKKLIWSSSNSSVGTINENGYFHALKTGRTVISAQASSGIKDEVAVTVIAEYIPEPIHVSSVFITGYTPTSPKVDDEVIFVSQVLPEDAFDKGVIWSVRETDASITQEGIFKASKAGKYTIVAKSHQDDTKFDEVEITVSDKDPGIIKLETPKLSLNKTTGVVSWPSVSNATKYKYYINGGLLQETTNTSVTLSNGESISVLADSSLDNVIASSWSKPISYVNIDDTYSTATIYFRDAPNLNSIYVKKGTAYTAPTNPVKGDYIFDGWYLDGFCATPFIDGSIIEEDTILFAKWKDPSYIDGAVYYLKCDEKMSHSQKSKANAWGTIPLKYDASETASHNNKKIYSATVTVSNASSSDSPCHYLVMDGFDDNNGSDHMGRTYWKNIYDSDFLIESSGTYKIRFSVEHYWTDEVTGLAIHASAKKMSTVSQVYKLSANKSFMVNANEDLLDTPVVSIDSSANVATWTPITGAVTYAYIIDNGDVKTTTSNYVTLYQGQSIVVRAIADNEDLSSKWSIPSSFPYKHYEQGNFAYVHFYDIDRPSFKITKGEKVTKGDDPTKAGYEFKGYYKDINFVTSFDFDTPITKNTVIYAKWEVISSESPFMIVDTSGNKLADFTVNLNQTAFNEYKATLKTTKDDVTVKIVDEDKRVYKTLNFYNASTYTIYFSREHFYDREKQTVTYVECNEYFYWYLTKNSNLSGWDRLCAYAWTDDNTQNATWPGVQMEYDSKNQYGEDVYKIKLSKYYKYLKFNNGGKDGGYSKSTDITLPHNQSSYNAFWLGDKNNDGERVTNTWKK